MPETTLTIRRPDDFHVHLRDGALLAACAPFSARTFGRVLAMPNLQPPVTTTAAARAYRERILAAMAGGISAASPEGGAATPAPGCLPLLACYLTDATDPADLVAGFRKGVFAAAKLYPAGATTNAASGVTDVARIRPVLAAMQEEGMVLSVHGEVADADVDPFDREALFVDRVLAPLRRDFPELRIVLEHLSTARAAECVLEGDEYLAATITPHHLWITRAEIFRGGLRPHNYCLPLPKTAADRAAVRRAAISGHPRIFLGTDSAPHLRAAKETGRAPAGVFNAPRALAWVAQAFEEEGALDRLEPFAAENGARFYGLAPNAGAVTLRRLAAPRPPLGDVATVEGPVRCFEPEGPLYWRAES
ncbi:MAG: dihydroorotase [Desulfovibrionaceae bacterium]|jgi:dihydroorotase|nr:dihydroorotase [Desulfovibrionaceae bacterium]